MDNYINRTLKEATYRKEWLNLMTMDGEGEKQTDKGHPSQGTAGPPNGELIALNSTNCKRLNADV